MDEFYFIENSVFYDKLFEIIHNDGARFNGGRFCMPRREKLVCPRPARYRAIPRRNNFALIATRTAPAPALISESAKISGDSISARNYTVT